MLSIIIPTLNETKSGYLSKILKNYESLLNTEIICVDGGSSDGTKDLIKNSIATLITTDIPSRAGRLNIGIRAAKYDLVLLNHPRSLLQKEGINELMLNYPKQQWGAFTHRFDQAHLLLRFTSWYSNFVRGDLRGIFYLDHCLFAQKNLLEKIHLFPEIEIFEDTKLCLSLNKHAKPVRLPYLSTTSAIRFTKNGIWSQAIKNQYLKWAYYFKFSDKKMNQIYEKNLDLNTEYKK